MTVTRNDWTRAALEAEGFVGWVPFARLREADVSAERGVYVVWRPTKDEPQFLDASVSGRHNGKDQTISVTELRGNWVDRASVVYIGRAGDGKGSAATLRSRLKQYAAAGVNATSSHSGGRSIWQLSDHDTLLVAWRPTSGEDPQAVESAMIEAFVAVFGKRPFANRRPEPPPLT